MLRKVKLYGPLAKFVGKRVLKADISTAAEAVRFLIANWPELERHMANQHYRVEVDEQGIELDALHNPIGLSDVKIIPVITGAGGRNTKMILIGVALIGISFLLPGAGLFGTVGAGGTGATTASGAAAAGSGLAASGWTAAGIGTTIGTMASAVGASMILYGVSGMLTPTPGVPDSSEDPVNSFSFSGVQQTDRAGTAVPICYGEIMTGSIVISAEIDVDEVTT